jgi:hypothetical protein
VPFLGFDETGHLVGEVLHGQGPEPREFGVAVDPALLPESTWSYVAMTWEPGSPTRLYVGGREAAHADTPRFHAYGAKGALLYVTWGSSNLRGAASCFLGAIAAGPFQGAIADWHVYETALGPDAVRALAKASPRP